MKVVYSIMHRKAKKILGHNLIFVAGFVFFLLCIFEGVGVGATYSATVNSSSELVAAINRFNGTSDSVEITISGSVNLSGDLPIIKGNGENTLTITGGVINGSGQYRGLLIDSEKADGSGTSQITVDGTTFQNCVAQGGQGGSGAIGGGGGMGAGGAIFAKSGDIVLKDVVFTENIAQGGRGGNVLYQSNTYGGGGGLGGNGAGGTVGDALTNTDGSGGDGGSIGKGNNGASSTASAGKGGGYLYSPTEDKKQNPHYVGGSTTLAGGDGGYGGGGGGSIGIGGDGGLGGGGGAGALQGGEGGFGAGGAGGTSANSAGTGGFGAGNGGYVADIESSNGFGSTPGGGTGGGGAGLGGALYIEKGANVSLVYSSDSQMSGNVVLGGSAGIVEATRESGTATAGSGIGSGVFLKDNLNIDVAENATYTINNILAGDPSAESRDAGLIKEGEGTLVLKFASSYYGDTTVSGGLLQADAMDAISPYSILNIENGTVKLNADQHILDLQGGPAAVLDLGGKTLNVTRGHNEEVSGVYDGVIQSNGASGTGGKLVKSGTEILHLTGDSSSYNFTTTLEGGSIQIGDAGSLGSGKIVYARTDTTDIAKALIFDESMILENDIELNGNKDMMRLGTAGGSPMEVELAGRITAADQRYGTILLDARDASQIFRLSNTGVNAGVYNRNNENTLSTIDIKKGTLAVDTEKVGELFYSGLASASVNNNGENTFKLISTEDDVWFKNDFTYESGLLSIENERAGQNYHLSGKMSGKGGLALNMIDEDDVLYLSGRLTYEGPTRIINGVLDLSDAKTGTHTSGGVSRDYVYLIGLETNGSTESAKVITGTNDLYLGGIDDYSYQGIITDGINTGTGSNIYKISAGQLDLSLESGSKVNAITVQNGTLNLVDRSLESIPIILTNTGVLGISTDIELDDLDPSVAGTGIQVNQGSTLTLGAVANKQNIAANLDGNGTLILMDRTSIDTNDWRISGTNSEWNGILQTASGSNLILASQTAAGGEDAKIQLGSNASLTSLVNTTVPNLEMDGSATLKVKAGSKLTVKNLDHKSSMNQGGLTLQGLVGEDGSILNGGTLILDENAASDYYGLTTVNRSVLMILGNNNADPTGGTRDKTILNGSTLVLDYSKSELEDPATAFGSLWGDEDLEIKGAGGRIEVQGTDKAVVLSNDIQFGDGGVDSKGNDIIPQAIFTVHNPSVTYNGVFSGEEGDLRKEGPETLILDGDNTSKIIGKTVVFNGILQLGNDSTTMNQQLTGSDLLINEGGYLTGWADEFKSLTLFGGLDMNNIGPIRLNAEENKDALVLCSRSFIYADMLDANNYTRFTSENGNMKLQGGTIRVEVDEAYIDQVVNGTTLEMFETDNGSITVNTPNLIFLDNIVGKRLVAEKIGNNKVNLVFRNLDFTEFATTGNSLSIAKALNRIPDLGGGIYPQVSAQLENAVIQNRNFLNELTGELNISGFNAQVSTRNLLRQTIINTLYPTSDSQIFRSSSSLYRGQIREPDHSWSGWGNVFGSLGDVKSNDGISGYDYEMMGGVFGLELGSTDTAQAGLFYSYLHSKLGTNTNIGSLKLDENLFGGYFRWDDALGYGLLIGSANTTKYTGNRSIYIDQDENGTFKSDRDGSGFSIYGERGYTFQTGRMRIQPYFGLQYINLKQDGFEETGGNTLANYRLKMDDSDYNSFQSVLGIRGNIDGLVNNRPIRAFVYANWIHEFLDTWAEGTATFAAVQGQLPSFRIVGNDLGSNWILGGFGGQCYMADQFQLFGSVDYLASSKSWFVGGNIGVRYLW